MQTLTFIGWNWYEKNIDLQLFSVNWQKNENLCLERSNVNYHFQRENEWENQNASANFVPIEDCRAIICEKDSMLEVQKSYDSRFLIFYTRTWFFLKITVYGHDISN